MCRSVHALCDIYDGTSDVSNSREIVLNNATDKKLPQTMSQKHLNACMLLSIHKDRTDAVDVHKVAKSFVNDVSERVCYFGKIQQPHLALTLTHVFDIAFLPTGFVQ